ncbi:hypothetical protein [Aestuariicoccus sp. MJ-SS9]|uniref:hypothetical protein n=1 Tax=Aestuariicoccus sp. MJ-SS9 TaxID=3079855 RepID=UPI00290724A9|nr:hypothetical protein [Aestuariicoccus sp. MJ-SS9]MDU8911026.1 hypothetical protein [Aestuariicoccus sp. MJ-SS9]
MLKLALVPALLTGVFCAAFAVGVDFVVGMKGLTTVIVISFVSGFLGNCFAQIVTGRDK